MSQTTSYNSIQFMYSIKQQNQTGDRMQRTRNDQSASIWDSDSSSSFCIDQRKQMSQLVFALAGIFRESDIELVGKIIDDCPRPRDILDALRTRIPIREGVISPLFELAIPAILPTQPERS